MECVGLVVDDVRPTAVGGENNALRLPADGITATKLVIAYCAGMAAASVPIVPGGLGVVDGALVLGLVAGGVAGSSAVAAVVLYRLISFGFIIGAGWLVWLVLRHRAKDSPRPG